MSTSAYTCFGLASGVVLYLKAAAAAPGLTTCHGPGPRKRSRGTRASASTSGFDFSLADTRSRSAYARRICWRPSSVCGTTGAVWTEQQGIDQDALPVSRDVKRVIGRVRHRRVEELSDAVDLELGAVARDVGHHQRRRQRPVSGKKEQLPAVAPPARLESSPRVDQIPTARLGKGGHVQFGVRAGFLVAVGHPLPVW